MKFSKLLQIIKLFICIHMKSTQNHLWSDRELM